MLYFLPLALILAVLIAVPACDSEAGRKKAFWITLGISAVVAFVSQVVFADTGFSILSFVTAWICAWLTATERAPRKG